MLDPAAIDALLAGRRRSVPAACMRGLLTLAEPAYALAASTRNLIFDHAIRGARPLGRPTISVGNLTVGGTGKSPMVRWLAERLHEWGHTPAVLLRGYRATPGHGSDEAIEHAQALAEVAFVAADPSRHRSAAHLLADHPEVSVFLLDDGFQHRQAARDLDLVLIDASNPFGYEHLLPRGLMREPARSLRRAHAVVLTHADAVDHATLDRIDARVMRWHGRPPIARARHLWRELLDEGDRSHQPDALAHTPTLAVCGLGRPRGFFDAAARHARLCETVAFPDHHAYAQADLRQVFERARALQARAVLTTAKDWVKWRGLLAGIAPDRRLPVYRAALALEVTLGRSELIDRVQAAAGQPPDSAGSIMPPATTAPASDPTD